ncbi:multidrug resistance protein 1 [Rhizoctonia solani AG-1 IA]|uniref:Multidrug resistance protein 1 n=1 Tax=Thanatephorus cucumeris (strain AG1-IA) TaxID=983506 RepID=L8WRY4_THACA|nr:multidrug resistance protein 1 [Rhizoctonia solani AG-1 IA]
MTRDPRWAWPPIGIRSTFTHDSKAQISIKILRCLPESFAFELRAGVKSHFNLIGQRIAVGLAPIGGDSTSDIRRTTNVVSGVSLVSIASSRMTDRLRRAYLSSVIHQDAEFFENVGPGEVGTRMIKDVASVRAAVGEKLSILIWSTLIVAIVMAFSRAPRLAGVVFSIIPFSFIAFTIIGQLSSKAEGRLLTIDGQASTLLEQILSSVRVVQSFAAETFLAKKYDAYLQPLFSVVNILPHILAIKDSISVSAQLLKDIERVPKIDICRTDGAKLWEDEKVNAQIALRDVTFSYPSRPDHKSLDSVSMVLEGGKVTALVGGVCFYKCTGDVVYQTNFALQLLVPESRSLNLAWLRSQISLVSQEPQLFTASIFENVAYGLTGTIYELPSDPSEDQLQDARRRVEWALKQAQAWEFVCNLPEGMDTRVSGARTGVLSGGQRQRIAAARALVRRPRILLLDEGTSALDSETEQKLMKAIHKEQTETGMTTILIAHRLSSIQNADKIIALGGVFSNLVKHQIPATQPSSQKPETSGTERVAPPTLSASPRLIKCRPDSDGSTVATDPETLERGEPIEKDAAGSLSSRFVRIMAMSHIRIFDKTIGFSGASFPIAAWLIGFVMKTFSIQDDDARLLREARKWSFWFLILAIINIGTSFVVGFFLSAGADRIDRRLRIVSLTSLLKQEIGYFDKEENASGALTAAIATHANNIASAIGLVWQQLVSATGNFVGSLVLGLICKPFREKIYIIVPDLPSVSWKLTLLGISPIPFIIAAAYYNIIFIEKYERQIQKPREEASAFASENVDAIKTVAALGREDAVMQQFDKSASKYSAKGRNLAIGAIGFGVGIGSILILSSIVMWWGTALYLRGQVTLEGLYSSFEAIVIAGYSASRMFTFIPDWARMVHGFRSVCDWEDRQPQVAALNLSNPNSPEYKGLDKVEGELTFNSCTLKYASRPKPAVSDVSFTIKPGQSIAFCGKRRPSGGGKSSIISMISRFYDPTTGTISLDGQDIRYIPLEEYRSHIALVSQDAILYEGTFHENITLGEASISQEQLERACRDASILEFIQSLPQGFDTSVGFKGSQMSGGQRQRICIARALLRNPKILLVSLALDAESERSVKEALEQASKGRTTISIAHRLSTIQGADVIHVVEEGRIVESGSHLELLALNGRYVDLIRSQL